MGASGLILVVAVIGTVTSVGASTEGCPQIVLRSQHYAKVHNKVCYLFINEERYWKDARSACWNLGGEMLAIKDRETMEFIRDTLNSRQLRWTRDGVWLGARYSGGRWRWTSGEKMDYSNWSSGEPSKLLGIFSVEDCALMRRDDNWRWHDYVCGALKFHYNYICQFPFNYQGHHEPHYASQSVDNGNMAILTIILATGGIVLLILLLVFLIFRKRYNYKKALRQPTVHFENSNYSNHTNREPMPPPPAPYAPQPRPLSDMYLTPVEVGACPYYEEVQKPNGVAPHLKKESDAHQTSLTISPAGSNEMLLGACGGASPFDLDSTASDSTPLVSGRSEGASFLGQSEESLHSMSGSLTMKTSNVHNDYVDMNGSPVVSNRCSRETEPTSKPTNEQELPPKGFKDDTSKGVEGNTTAAEENKPATDHEYGNLTSSQTERCENVYLRLS